MVKKYTSMIFFRIFGANMRFLTSKTSFSAFIFSQAQIGPKNSEKIHRTVFSYYGWPWIFSEFLELIYA